MFSIIKKKYLENYNSTRKSSTLKEHSNDYKDSIKYQEDDDYEEDSDDEEYKEYDQKYSFLDDDNNPLSKLFYGNYNEQDICIHLCIYRVNMTCKIPFLEFLLDVSEIPQFPNISNFKCPNFPEDQELQQHTFFMNKCLEHLLKLLDFHKIFGIELLNRMYKGFVQQDDKNLFVVFEYISELDFFPSINEQWVILDEILLIKQVNRKEIHSTLSNFFQEQNYMTEIFTADKNKVHPLPFLMNICEKKDDRFTCLKKKSIIDLTILGVPWIGDFYYFTSNIDYNEAYQKYAVFTDDSIYILRDLAMITDKQKNIFVEKYKNIENMAIYFHENDKEIWCVKSSDAFTRL